MSKPDVTIEVLDFQLGQLPASIANAAVQMGVCSQGDPETLYSLGDINSLTSTLGTGPLVEALADTLGQAGGPQLGMPLNPSVAGAVGSTTHTGTGAATVTGSAAPAKLIDLKITTGGALGTMAFAWRLNGGQYSDPVTTTITSFSYRVPGTLTTVTFTAHTYTLNDVWSVSTLGVITVVGSGTAGWVTQVSSTLDGYSVRVTIETGGALGTAVFNVSVDGGNQLVGGSIATPGGGAYAIPNTGIVLTFSGTSVEDDVYTFTTTTAGFGTSDVTAAFTALFDSPIEWAWAHIVGMGTNAAAAASMAGVVDTQMGIAESSFRYAFGIVECPTASEADTALVSAFASFASTRTMVCAGDIGHRSSISSRVIRRNCATVISTRLSEINPGHHPGVPGDGKVPNVVSLYPQSGNTKWSEDTLDAQRFATMRSHQGLQGFYVTNGNMMAESGSDFSQVMPRRVIDIACRIVRAQLLLILNSAVRVARDGLIYQPEAQQIENRLTALLRNSLCSGPEPDAVDVSVVVDRTENIISTHRLPVSIRVTPNGYAQHIEATIGLNNPALALAA